MANHYAKPSDEDDPFNIVAKPLAKGDPKEELEFLQLARERAAYAFERWERNFDEAEHDVNFVVGEDQWDPQVKLARSGRPCLTFNTLPQYVDQITGAQRQTRPAIHIHPADDHGRAVEFERGKEKKKVKAAEIYEGIIRAIEFNSNAEQHYDTAFEHAVDGGFGWLRVLPQYASGKTFDQELRIRHVPNRWAVLMDPDAEEPDMSDAAFAFVFGQMDRTEYETRYPDAPRSELDALGGTHRKVWLHGQRVGVAEYFWREGKMRELLLMSDNRLVWADEVKDVMEMLAQMGITVMRSRKVVDWCVNWRKIGAFSVLEKTVRLPFRTIPIVPVLGKEKHLRDGETLYRSAIRDAKEPKQAENYWLSAATERVALSPKAPWVAEAEAIEGYEREWERANDGDIALLRYNTGFQPPQRTPPASMPVAEVQMAQIMVDHVKSAIGMYDASLGAQSNETSGRALMARQNQANTSTFVFQDNCNRAIRRVGLLLLEAIPKIYDAERVMRLRNADGTDDWIKVNQAVPVLDPATGEPKLDANGQPELQVINGLGQGEFDAVVKSGPSFATQRQEASEAQMQLLQLAPALIDVIGDKVVENMDWPQAGEITKRMRKRMDPKLLSKQEAEDLEAEPEVDPQTGEPIPPQPTPEEAAMQEAAAAAQQEAQAATIEAEAKAMDAQAKMVMAEAKMAEAEAKMQALQQELALMQDAGALAEMVRQIVAQEVTQRAQPKETPNVG